MRAFSSDPIAGTFLQAQATSNVNQLSAFECNTCQTGLLGHNDISAQTG